MARVRWIFLESVSEYFDHSLKEARAAVRQVAEATKKWRVIAKEVEAPSSEIDRSLCF